MDDLDISFANPLSGLFWHLVFSNLGTKLSAVFLVCAVLKKLLLYFE
jgi:hypothetical protein